MGDNHLENVSLVRLSTVRDIDAGGVAYTPPSNTNRWSYIITDKIQEGTRTSNKY